MFLSKEALIKAILIPALFLPVGIFFFVLSYLIGKSEASPVPCLIAGIVFTLISVVSAPLTVYFEGVSKLYSAGVRLVHKELLPEEFISLYKEKSEPGKNVISRPGYDILEMLYNACDLLDDRAGARVALNKMRELKPRFRGRSAVLEAAEAYKRGDIASGDAFLSKAEEKYGSSEVRAAADALRKSERAMASGDFAAAKEYYSGIAGADSVLGPDSDAILKANWYMYIICRKTGDPASSDYLGYCAEHGGSTAIGRKAGLILRREGKSEK
ncbi:MAG: hypothetical protein J5879_10395 [Clostridia bacterium]|nr:hypothetical protein [Clostridia bacterium]